MNELVILSSYENVRYPTNLKMPDCNRKYVILFSRLNVILNVFIFLASTTMYYMYMCKVLRYKNQEIDMKGIASFLPIEENISNGKGILKYVETLNKRMHIYNKICNKLVTVNCISSYISNKYLWLGHGCKFGQVSGQGLLY